MSRKPWELNSQEIGQLIDMIEDDLQALQRNNGMMTPEWRVEQLTIIAKLRRLDSAINGTVYLREDS